jgi:hypothetical protein
MSNQNSAILKGLMGAFEQTHNECVKKAHLLKTKENFIEDLNRHYKEKMALLIDIKDEHHQLTQHYSILLETTENLELELARIRLIVKNVLTEESKVKLVEEEIHELKVQFLAKNQEQVESLLQARQRFRATLKN